MKRHIIIILILLATAFGSCKKFLEESSQNQLRPSTVTDLAQTLLGEGYPLRATFHTYIDIISDDVTANYLSNDLQIAVLNKWASGFLWKKTMFEDLLIAGSSSGVDSYEAYYKKIKGCNVVMDNLEKVNGIEAEKNTVKAEALFLRSFYYFNLVNLFGKPYGGAGSDPETDLGIPLILSAEVTSVPIKRATIAQVYNKIEVDLSNAYNLLNANPSNIYHPSKAAAALLLSRVYLYKHEWDKSIEFATAALQIKSSLKNLNEVAAVPPSGFTEGSPYYQICNGLVSPEVIWSFGDYGDYSNSPLGQAVVVFNRTPFSVSASLSGLYESADRRNVLYFNMAGELAGSDVNWYRSHGIKYNPANGVAVKAFRVAEAYLNRTEAYIQKAIGGDAQAITLALSDLNRLRSNRITTASYSEVAMTDPASLYTFYQQERRRELCFEDQRWFDLRRWNLPVSHTLQLNANVTETITLQPGDIRFTLPIPQSALLVNPDLTPNP